MVTQGKLPLNEDVPRLKLAMENSDDKPVGSLEEELQDEHADDSRAEHIRIEPELHAPPAEDIDDDIEENLTVGMHLKRERERQGFSLHDIAEDLRLRPRQLQALEDGNYDALPGQTFVAGFLRSYAGALGLDAVVVVDLYKSENSGDVGVPELAFPEPTPEGRMPGSKLLVGCCVAAIMVVAAWYFYLNENTIKLEIVPELSSRLMEKLMGSEEDASRKVTPMNSNPAVIQSTTTSLPNPIEEFALKTLDTKIVKTETTTTTVNAEPNDPVVSFNQAPATAENMALDKPEEVVGISKVNPINATVIPKTKPALTTSLEPILPQNLDNIERAPKAEVVTVVGAKTVEPGQTEAVEIEPAKTQYPQQTLDATQIVIDTEIGISPRPIALGVENNDARLVLVARQESWVQIKAADNGLVLDRILEAGDTFMLPSQTGMILSTANAAGLELRLDGTSLGMLGRYGEIIQELHLDPEQLKEKLQVSN
ncbi:MAG: helix-turn-helix domain-containing protein [Sneathiella sp.]|nr:helix-turn-helix domain-containing protein [Sneathiella sp.]